MENQPKKSKALIITFIAILVLLLAGYFIFKNSDSQIGTKNSSGISKIFAPLLGTSKNKDVDVVNTGNQNTNGGANQGGTTTGTGDGTETGGTGAFGGSGTIGSGDGLNGTGTGGTGAGMTLIPPAFNPIPAPTDDCRDDKGNIIACGKDTTPGVTTGSTQCADGIDNDGDGLIDTKDDGCHTDFTATNNLTYNKNLDAENKINTTTTTAVAELCPDDPLEFTTAEKDQLTVLLRQYYLLAPSLRIQDDITLLDYDNQTNQELLSQATKLIQDCNAQKADPAYTGPKEVKDNPYYKNTNTNRSSSEYLSGYGLYELMFNIW